VCEVGLGEGEADGSEEGGADEIERGPVDEERVEEDEHAAISKAATASRASEIGRREPITLPSPWKRSRFTACRSATRSA
jgi:hypothetical protein